MAEKYNSSRQLKIPVHITLIPPFRYENEGKVIKAFEETTDQQKINKNIELKGFDHFREKVLFVAVNKSQDLDQLQLSIHNGISNMLDLKWPEHYQSYHPHITIANRDLTPNAFLKAWPIFKDRPYTRTFQLKEICLFKHIDGKWNPIKTHFIAE